MPALRDKIVLITRSREQSPKEIAMLEQEGAAVIAFPTIRTKSIENTNQIDSAVNNLNDYNYIIFSSKNAVKFFIDRLKALDKSIPDSCRIICVGSKTHEYTTWNNIKVDIVPEEFSARGILQALASEDKSNKKVLIPTSVIARDELSNGLKKAGADVHVIPVYDVQPPELTEVAGQINEIIKMNVDAFIFTSPSSFVNCLKLLSVENSAEYFSNTVVVAIGDTTKDAIVKYGINEVIVPTEFTVDASVTGLIGHFKSVYTN